MLTFVVDGPDGAGKSTLCAELARQINASKRGLKAVHVGLPSSAIQDFRTMILGAPGRSPVLDQGKIVWTKRAPLYGAAGWLMFLANMVQTYVGLTLLDQEMDDELVVFMDREVPSTLAYQFYMEDRAGVEHNPVTFQEYLDITSACFAALPSRQGLILLHGTDEYPLKPKKENHFDTLDQDGLNTFFNSYLRTAVKTIDHPVGSWLLNTYGSVAWYNSMAYDPNALAYKIIQDLDII